MSKPSTTTMQSDVTGDFDKNFEKNKDMPMPLTLKISLVSKSSKDEEE